MASKLTDEGQDFLGFLQKVLVKQEKRPDPPATRPSPMKNRKGLPAAFAAFNQSLRSISTSSKGSKGNNKVSQEPPAAVPVSPKKEWTPLLKSFDLKRKPDHTVSTRASTEKSYLVSSPATEGATSEKETALKHKVASRHGELLEERKQGPRNQWTSRTFLHHRILPITREVPKFCANEKLLLSRPPENHLSEIQLQMIPAAAAAKLKRDSKNSSKDDFLLKDPDIRVSPGSKGELSKKVSIRSLAEELSVDEPANKDARGSKSKKLNK